jgi:hypothetical protein
VAEESEKVETEVFVAPVEAVEVDDSVEEVAAQENDLPYILAPDGTIVYVKYKRSYMSKIIQSKDVLKERYSIIKNKLLTIKGVKNRVSWSCESFKIGHKKLAHITMKGKTLTLCLPFDPSEYADSKYPFYDHVQDHCDDAFRGAFSGGMRRNDRRYAARLLRPRSRIFDLYDLARKK